MTSMMRTAVLIFALCSLNACAGFPSPNPPESSFSESDYQAWSQVNRRNPEVIGVWRSIEAGPQAGSEVFWYRFDEKGLFVAADEAFFERGEGKPEWEGAYRANDKELICHFQRKRGSDDWLNSRGGKGELKTFPYTAVDRDTLILENQTSQKLSLKFRRAVIKED